MAAAKTASVDKAIRFPVGSNDDGEQTKRHPTGCEDDFSYVLMTEMRLF